MSAQSQYSGSPAAFTETEVSSLLSELSFATDKAAFGSVLSRFDSQFLARYKTKFPTSPGKFPFGSMGKPYTYQPYAQAPYPFLHSGPSSVPTTQRPYTARPDDRPYQTPYTTGFGDSGTSFAGNYQYRVTTPPNPRVKAQEQPYAAPIYDRAMERSFERPMAAAYSGPKAAYSSISDFAELRKSKEDQLYRFQGQQRPPNV